MKRLADWLRTLYEMIEFLAGVAVLLALFFGVSLKMTVREWLGLKQWAGGS